MSSLLTYKIKWYYNFGAKDNTKVCPVKVAERKVKSHVER